MSFDVWPTEEAVGEFLQDCGFSSLPSADIGTLVERAVAELESVVGFSPFLAGDSTTVELIADEAIALPMPLASIESVSLGDEEIEFKTCPEGVVPIRVIRLVEINSGQVSVTGKVGFGLTIPSDVWHAVRDLAASWVMEIVAQSAGSDIESVKQDSVTIKYRTEAMSSRISSMLADRARLVFARYWSSGMGG